jgi:hypothetical protein
MENLDKEKIVAELIGFEKEEAELIKLYKTLLDMGLVIGLPPKEQAEFNQNLTKLYEDSMRHMREVAGVLNKYK